MRLLKVDMYAKTAWLFKQYASARLITVAHPLSAFRIVCCFLRVCLLCTRFERLTLALFTVRCPGPPCVCILRQRVNILDDDFIRIKKHEHKKSSLWLNWKIVYNCCLRCFTILSTQYKDLCWTSIKFSPRVSLTLYWCRLLMVHLNQFTKSQIQ